MGYHPKHCFIGLNLLLRDWLVQLCACGVDLQQYGKREKELHSTGNAYPFVLFRFGFLLE
jgi:hypothetical protein